MRLVCYAQADKEKSRRVLEAFAAGSGAKMEWATASSLPPGVVPVFYGVRPAWAHLWEQAKAEGRDWVYVDNAYFDSTRERSFRATLNAIQHSGRGTSDGLRFAALDLLVKPPKQHGRFILACAQSDEFMSVVAKDAGWLPRIVEECRSRGEQVLVRHKGEKRPLAADLENAKLVATWSSSAAVEAVLRGVPVRCSPRCCAHGIIDRTAWAGVLADNQWTLEEFARGKAAKALGVEMETA